MKQNLSNMTFSKCLADILENNKIMDICICPGSRNTSLNIAFLNNSYFNCKSHIDERAAAFFSLGVAKESLEPSVIVTTSGTAVANLLPAVIEADLSTTPLIIISADRPNYLHKIGENQTIEQKNILDNFVRESIHVEISTMNYKTVFNKIQDIISLCKGVESKNPPGPIHINIAFDEPLVDRKYNKRINPKKIIHKIKNNRFTIPNCKRPLIICGKSDNEFGIDQIIELSKKLNAPILADPLYNLRYNHKHENILSFYDFFIEKLKPYPDYIIRIGKKPVSKKLNQLLKKLVNKTILLTKYNGYNDDANAIYIQNLKNLKIDNKANDKWIRNNQKLNQVIDDKMNNYLNQNHYYEGNVINHCLKKFNHNDNLFIGNSLCVRNLENYCPNMNKKINVYSNRGASGIDGIIATAIGIAYKNKAKTNLIIGDISFFYDSNSILIAQNHKIDINIIIINNNGGQIFNKLPYAKDNIKEFKEFWTTPVNLSIKKISQVYKTNYSIINSIKKIDTKLDTILKKPGINIIEIVCDFKKTLKIEEQIKKEI